MSWPASFLMASPWLQFSLILPCLSGSQQKEQIISFRFSCTWRLLCLPSILFFFFSWVTSVLSPIPCGWWIKTCHSSCLDWWEKRKPYLYFSTEGKKGKYITTRSLWKVSWGQAVTRDSCSILIKRQASVMEIDRYENWIEIKSAPRGCMDIKVTSTSESSELD